MSDEHSNREEEQWRPRRKRVLPTFIIFATVYFGIRGCVSLASHYFGDPPPQTNEQPRSEDDLSGPE